MTSKEYQLKNALKFHFPIVEQSAIKIVENELIVFKEKYPSLKWRKVENTLKGVPCVEFIIACDENNFAAVYFSLGLSIGSYFEVNAAVLYEESN